MDLCPHNSTLPSDPCACLDCFTYKGIAFHGCTLAYGVGHAWCIVSPGCESVRGSAGPDSTPPDQPYKRCDVTVVWSPPPPAPPPTPPLAPGISAGEWVG